MQRVRQVGTFPNGGVCKGSEVGGRCKRGVPDEGGPPKGKAIDLDNTELPHACADESIRGVGYELQYERVRQVYQGLRLPSRLETAAPATDCRRRMH